MDRGNVLVIGNSGVGKSTLINAVLGEDVAVTGYGAEGTTKELKIYESDSIPFRLIDTVGFEPTFIKERGAIHAVKAWSKESAKKGHEDNNINAIWFCVDGTAKKLFPNAITNLSKATKMWGSVPVIVVITKSYSTPERVENIEMVNNAFAKEKRYSKNLRKVIPVVASPFWLNETAFAAPEGITEIIDATNEVMPEGLKAGEKDVASFKLKRKRALAQSVVGVSTAAGVVVGAVPIPLADALILSPIEIAEINTLARMYGINKSEDSKRFLSTIVEVGTASLIAKTAISTLKAIPGVNIAASVLNAVIAGSIVAAIGEASIYAFEKIYLGEKSIEDLDWIRKLMESKLSTDFIDKVTQVVGEISRKENIKNVDEAITNLLTATFGASEKVSSTY